MIRTKFITLAAAALLATTAAYGQIRVETSTGTATSRSADTPIQISVPGAESDTQTSVTVSEEAAPARTSDEPIQINMPRSGESRVQVTTSPGAAAPTTSTEEIQLTPAQFRELQIQRAREQQAQQTPEPMITPEPVTTPESVPETDNSAEPAEEPALTPAPEPAEPDEETVDYLPPAEFDADSFIEADGENIVRRPEDLDTAALEVTVPSVDGTTFSNGVRFYHYEDKSLPRVRVNLIIDAGQIIDPADKVGLAEITARTMRSGGAGDKSGDEIDSALEQIGSDLEIDVARDHIAASMFALSNNVDQAVGLLADIIRNPKFEEGKFALEKERALEELRRQNDNPGTIVRREFSKIVYGPEHPLARTPTSATISNISRDDVRKFHEDRYRPSTLWVGVSGDISQEDARKLVETAFGDWDRPAIEKFTLPALDDPEASRTVYLTKKATAQSQIRLGHVGLERRSEKAYAVNVLNSIYGTGGFSSRLMNRVRTQHGYVYGVGGGIMSDDPVGLFVAAAASKGATTAAAIREILDVTQSVIDGPISEEELETARRDIVFTFTNQFDTPQSIVKTHMLYDFRGYAPDYLETFQDRVRAVTLDDLKAVASELLHPDNIQIYVIGNPADFDAELSEFGPVKDWHLEDYTGQ